MIALDDILDRAREAKARHEASRKELDALVKALDGLAAAGFLDSSQKRELGRLRPTKRRRSRRTTRRAT